MSVTEKISAYFDRLVSENKLRPGDKLPKYAEICELFGISYTSAQRSFKKLEQEGRIKIVNGIGSFLNGGDMLEIEMYLTGTSFDFSLMESILNEISDENMLHLKFILKERYHCEAEFAANPERRKIAIIEGEFDLRLPGVLLDYSVFPDYDRVCSEFRETGTHKFYNLELPFFIYTHQGAINPRFLKHAGFRRRITEFSSLDWWNEYLACCRNTGKIPAAKFWNPESLWNFYCFVFAVPVMMNARGTEKMPYATPFFNTKEGDFILEIMRNLPIANEYNFFSGDTGIEFNMGSWISVQHRKKFGLKDEDFRIVPYRFGKRKIVDFRTHFLQTFVYPHISENEKQRVWRLIKAMLSRKWQKRIMAVCGGVSVRNDMNFEDHPWAVREDFRAFIPEENDILIDESQVPYAVIASLTTLYEQFEFYGVDKSIIQRSMDSKMDIMNRKQT